ncbi:ABC transporter ATP-binding protein [Bacillus sp. NPDC077027]|uniref:ABC transporter ATP-binding protein n=1 Tax=Bacillus sp. NPDC077027 TaxID=3390548 RepID=UPI003D0190C8
MDPVILKIEGTDKKIGNKAILTNISMDIRQGEIVGLLGPNGSGKTTLIKLIVGLMKKSKGSIIINGFSQDKHFKKAMSSVGAIVENPEFYLHLTGYENLELYAAMYNHISEERIQEVITRVKLEHAIHQKVKTYSLGMKQRLGIAQAILHKPNLLILDEPTNGLDPAGMKDFREHLLSLVKDEGTSVLFATHLLHEVEELCDRMVIIQKGTIKATVNLQEANSANTHVRMEIHPSDQAADWLKTNGYTYEMSEGDFILQVKKEEVPILNKQLALADLQVYAIQPQKESIEAAFMKLTEGGTSHVKSHHE